MQHSSVQSAHSCIHIGCEDAGRSFMRGDMGHCWQVLKQLENQIPNSLQTMKGSYVHNIVSIYKVLELVSIQIQNAVI